jgi:transposase
MRGSDPKQPVIFSYVALEDRVPKEHPLRVIRSIVDRVLEDLSGDFSRLYAKTGRPSVPPEQMLRALLIQILFSVRSERQLMEQLDYNLLFRWFVGLSVDDPVWSPTTFSKNRDRLLGGDVAVLFFHGVVEQARQRHLLSSDHFTVDGTLLEAWASQKSFRAKDTQADTPAAGGAERTHSGGRNGALDFRGETRSNDTHASTTDPDARLARKARGKEARLCYSASVLMENRNGLLVDAEVRHATGRAEVETALAMLERQCPTARRRTLGADKLYDTREFVADCRALGVTPHVAQNTSGRRSAIDARTTRHRGYAESQRQRKKVEEGFGWGKSVGLLRKLRHRGLALVDWVFTFTVAAYNLVRMRTLLGEVSR